jgi:phospholipid/cholesterol/gamma-HCH transport system substrate-binding protein
MDERIVQFRVGVFVLATVIAAIILALLFGELPSLIQDTYTIQIRFADAPGVTKDTPVTKSGIRIGRVTDVQFAPDDNGVIVTAEIDANRRIPRTNVCRISKSLLGDARVEFVNDHRREATQPKEPEVRGSAAGTAVQPPLLLVHPVSYQQAQPATLGAQELFARHGVLSISQEAVPAEKGRQEASPYLEHGDTIVGEVKPEAMEVVVDLEKNLSKAFESVETTTNKFTEVIDQIRGLLKQNEERINNILSRSDTITTELQKTLQSINAIVGDEQTRQQLQEAIARMPDLIQDTHHTVNDMRDTVDKFNRNIDKIAADVGSFTGPLAETGPQILARLDKTSEKLDGALAELLAFSQLLNSGQGTIGRLAKDPQLYENVMRTVENVDDLVVKLRPILNDARVFSDKIARHPELLGVRGAIQRNPGIK